MTQKSMTPEECRTEYFPNMGRAAFYGALRRREIPSLRIGKKWLIPRAAIERLFDNCTSGAHKGGVDAA